MTIDTVVYVIKRKTHNTGSKIFESFTQALILFIFQVIKYFSSNRLIIMYISGNSNMLWIWMLSDNMKMAREKANIGMLTSDVDTAPSDVENVKSRERRHKNRFSKLDESDVETHTRQLSTKARARSPFKKSCFKASSSSTITEPVKKRPNLLLPPPLPQVIHHLQLPQSVRSPCLPDLTPLDDTAMLTSDVLFTSCFTPSRSSPVQNAQTLSAAGYNGISIQAT
jgi:hypothetical protein